MKKILAISIAILFFSGCSLDNKRMEIQDIQKKQDTTIVDSANKSQKIKNIGVNLDYYNPATNRAGDLEFFKIKQPYDRLFMDFGHIIAAEKTSNNKESLSPHPTFMLPLGTKVLALIDGVVINVPKLYSNDYSVQISQDGQRNGLVFELEHVKNPLVKVGDQVKAGQPVAEVTDFASEHHPGYGIVDIAVLTTKKDGQPQHLCPFLYLDDSIKEETFKKIKALYISWEKYIGDDALYDENSYNIPGCLSIEPIDG